MKNINCPLCGSEVPFKTIHDYPARRTLTCPWCAISIKLVANEFIAEAKKVSIEFGD